MGLRILLVAAIAGALLAPGAQAGLKNYYYRLATMTTGPNVSPSPRVNPPQERYIEPGTRPQNGSFTIEEGSQALIDDTTPGSPVLKKLLISQDFTNTLLVPGLGGFLFFSAATANGPQGEFTGTGSTDTTIAWGLVTGWTVSGGTWCHSAPAFICDTAAWSDQETVESVVRSPFYDFGTWTFHGTGFTGTPWILTRPEPEVGPGNTMQVPRGTLLLHGSVPALPLLGIAVLGGSLLVGAHAALRRRGE